MQAIFIFYAQLCLMRAGPEQLPRSGAFLAAVLAIYLVLSTLVVLTTAGEAGSGIALVRLVVSILFEALCIATLLGFKGFIDRFPPTMAALLGTAALANVVEAPLTLLIDSFRDTTIGTVAEVVFLLIYGWWLAIAGFILQRALLVSFIQGVFVALAIELLSIVVILNLVQK